MLPESGALITHSSGNGCLLTAGAQARRREAQEHALTTLHTQRRVHVHAQSCTLDKNAPSSHLGPQTVLSGADG